MQESKTDKMRENARVMQNVGIAKWIAGQQRLRQRIRQKIMTSIIVLTKTEADYGCYRRKVQEKNQLHNEKYYNNARQCSECSEQQ